MFSLADIEVLKPERFEDRSRQLAEFLRGDFQSIAAELRRVFPNTVGLQERFVPLVQRFAHELSGLYARPVVRRFEAPAAPTADGLAKLQAVYAASGIDAVLHQAHREVLAQNTVVLAVFPAGVGRVRVRVFAPYLVEWSAGDPMWAGELDAAQSVALKVPDSATERTVTYGRVVFTPTEIYRERKGGERVPVYGNSTRNPFGRIPLVVVRGEDPLPGRWAAPVNEPLLSMQLALCVSESDTELLVHQQAWGQKVLENAQPAQQVEELHVGPDKVLALVNNDPQSAGPRLAIVQGQPPLAQITGWNESRLRLLCSMFDLSPDAFLKVNTAVTASARAYDARDRAEARARFEPVFVRAEVELARIVAAVLNLTEPVKVPADVGVSVRWPSYDPPVDPLHESQAMVAEIGLGSRSVVDHVAERDGISRAAARARVESNLAERRELAALGSVLAGGPAVVPAPAVVAGEGGAA